MIIKSLGILIFITYVPALSGDLPAWVKNSTSLKNGVFLTVCQGSGPSVDLARASAIKECKVSASELLNQSFEVSATTIQTEFDSAYHQEVYTSEKFKNLLCEPQKEEIKELEGFFTVWIQCLFNLKKTVVETVPPVVKTVTQQGANVESNIVRGSNWVINLAIIPKCKNILVTGEKPRVIECRANPISIIISPEDKELIIRSESYQPKKIQIKEIPGENIQIFLDKI
jgi:hypothetical protein